MKRAILFLLLLTACQREWVGTGSLDIDRYECRKESPGRVGLDIGGGLTVAGTDKKSFNACMRARGWQ